MNVAKLLAIAVAAKEAAQVEQARRRTLQAQSQQEFEGTVLGYRAEMGQWAVKLQDGSVVHATSVQRLQPTGPVTVLIRDGNATISYL